MIQRPQALAQIRRVLRRSRVVALIGPRQCGKTTLVLVARHQAAMRDSGAEVRRMGGVRAGGGVR